MAVVTLFSYKLRSEHPTKCYCHSANSDAIFTAMPSVCLVHKWLICVWIAIIGFLVFGIIATILIVDTVHTKQKETAGGTAHLPHPTPGGTTPPSQQAPGFIEEDDDDDDWDGDKMTFSYTSQSTHFYPFYTTYSQLTTTSTSEGRKPTKNSTDRSSSTHNPVIGASQEQGRTTDLPTTPVTHFRSTQSMSSTTSDDDSDEETTLREIITLILIVLFCIGMAAVLIVVVLIRVCCPEGQMKYKRIRSRNLEEMFNDEQNYDSKVFKIFTLPLRKPKISLYTVSENKYMGVQQRNQGANECAVLIFNDDLRPPSYEEAIKCQDNYQDYYANCEDLPPRY